MTARIRHLSVGVGDPKKVAQVVAELTNGTVRPFHPVDGAYVCLWPDWNGQFVEFYPKDVKLVPTPEGAEFQSVATTLGPSSTHINLDVDLTGEEVKAISKRHSYQYAFRPSDGGPLHEVWIENILLLELVTKDLR